MLAGYPHCCLPFVNIRRQCSSFIIDAGFGERLAFDVCCLSCRVAKLAGRLDMQRGGGMHTSCTQCGVGLVASEQEKGICYKCEQAAQRGDVRQYLKTQEEALNAVLVTTEPSP